MARAMVGKLEHERRSEAWLDCLCSSWTKPERKAHDHTPQQDQAAAVEQSAGAGVLIALVRGSCCSSIGVDCGPQHPPEAAKGPHQGVGNHQQGGCCRKELKLSRCVGGVILRFQRAAVENRVIAARQSRS